MRLIRWTLYAAAALFVTVWVAAEHPSPAHAIHDAAHVVAVAAHGVAAAAGFIAQLTAGGA